jgi:hypothetical protein
MNSAKGADCSRPWEVLKIEMPLIMAAMRHSHVSHAVTAARCGLTASSLPPPYVRPCGAK